MTQASADALHTAQCQLATEWHALDVLAAMGFRHCADTIYCRSEIVRLRAIIARLEAK
jgi:hypothetical protein